PRRFAYTRLALLALCGLRFAKTVINCFVLCSQFITGIFNTFYIFGVLQKQGFLFLHKLSNTALKLRLVALGVGNYTVVLLARFALS
ncbi:MAG: hypothetical protein J6V09_00160, partial [Clostridia bacterium]|nr:hypothetical protein [Clostridia bacterium]